MSLSREQMLVEMGISPIWVLRDPAPANAAEAAVRHEEPVAAAAAAPVMNETPVEAPVRVASPVPPSAAADVGSLDWPALAKRVAECRLCTLCEQRKLAVLGVGDTAPDYLFIGEGPGSEEDARGEPFVGQAGKLLDSMLAALDIARGNRVYIANAVKCRPPGNRTPEAAEMAACWPYLERQIALLKPKIIVLLGKAAVHAVLHDDKSLASLRGQRFEYAGIPVVVTYHPAYLLRNLPDKAKAWEDLLFARRTLRDQTAPELPF
ncbi:uracil-DNA glycosylase [Dechloromonas sp. XY25]|uniref:Type-4 uracil-DNA glycosylase n=1 Tax=Dechloromonas hankyongensis TaxID=2908002 RepID=A0ABS9K3B9_9RHOO|nr:uracil-DNA glycosylase [Dechloromonas hankyongensis]MCG2577645.1 uracil-DNA glycosylase [Dechloromonas hankyongensis]